LQFPPIVFEPLKFISPGQSIFLVGGAIRDIFLGLPLKDLDYAVSGDPRSIAKRLADQHDGHFYVLDDERHAYRVLLGREGQKPLDLDFIQMRGNSIAADLKERDFTINAMAMDLAQPEIIIDPLTGGRNLQQRLLKPVAPTSLLDDPVRAIRAVRYAASLGLKIDHETIELIKRAAKFLDSVSVERKRDELFKILAGHHIHPAIQLLHRFEILPKLGFPARQDVEIAGRQMEILDDILRLVCRKADPDKKQTFHLTSLLLKLSRFSEGLVSHYFDPEPSGRNRRDILVYSILAANGISRDALAQFALSVEEMEIVLKLQGLASAAADLLHNPGELTHRELYRYFLGADQCGIDLVFLVLGKKLAELPDGNTQQTWLTLLDRAEQCLETWFEHPERVHPRPILSGKDLMFQFDLPPGPLIGELLDGLKEEQAAGVVSTRLDAIEWIESRLIKFK